MIVINMTNHTTCIDSYDIYHNFLTPPPPSYDRNRIQKDQICQSVMILIPSEAQMLSQISPSAVKSKLDDTFMYLPGLHI